MVTLILHHDGVGFGVWEHSGESIAVDAEAVAYIQMMKKSFACLFCDEWIQHCENNFFFLPFLACLVYWVLIEISVNSNVYDLAC